MAKDFHFKKEACSLKSNEPCLLESTILDVLRSSSPLAAGYRRYIASLKKGKAPDRGWHTNTELGCDLKTILHSSKRMKPNKDSMSSVVVTLTSHSSSCLQSLPLSTILRCSTADTSLSPDVMMARCALTSSQCILTKTSPWHNMYTKCTWSFARG